MWAAEGESINALWLPAGEEGTKEGRKSTYLCVCHGCSNGRTGGSLVVKGAKELLQVVGVAGLAENTRARVLLVMRCVLKFMLEKAALDQ